MNLDFDTWRYWCLPAGRLAPEQIQALLDVAPNYHSLADVRYSVDHSQALVTWSPDWGALPDWVAALAPYEITHAAALALVATPEWEPPDVAIPQID